MNLNYTINEKQEKAFEPLGEEVIYCIPFDISSDGKLVEDCYVAATEKSIIVFGRDGIDKRIPISDCDDIKCEPMVHSGILRVNIKETENLVCRFTMAYITQFSYFAEGVKRIKSGNKEKIISREPEKFCQICKRALPKTKECVKCSSKGRFMKRLADMASPFKTVFFALTTLSLVSTGLLLGARYVERFFVDNYLIPLEGEMAEIITFFAILLAMNGTVLGITVLVNKSSAKLGTAISQNLRKNIYAKLQKSSIEFIMERNPGELMNRIHNDTQAISRFFQIGFARMFSTLLTMTGALVIMFIMDPAITLAVIIMIPAILMVSGFFRRKVKRIFSAQWRFEDRANNQLQDAISGIRVIKAFGKEKQQAEKFQSVNLQLAEKQTKNEKFWATFHPSIGLLLGTTTLLIMFMGGRNVLAGEFTIGQLGQFMAYSAILTGPLSWMSMLPRLFYHTVTSIERIYDVLQDERELEESDNPKIKELEGIVGYNRVDFGYKPYEKVLEDVSFQVEKGEMIGIVGYSGAGKSTLINLLIRLYDPDYGNIIIDGENLKDYESRNYHSQLGIVLQETFLFSGTVLDNIRYSKPDATPKEVIMAAKVANAHDFIIKFPDGYNTMVGERGVNISGGEKQRIAIARAILCNPKILILDEATSSLDSETEFLIQEALSRLTKGRTTFAIAHRLSTLRKSDRILVIDENKIAEIGKHEDLIKKRGIYYNLVKAQLEMNKV